MVLSLSPRYSNTDIIDYASAAEIYLVPSEIISAEKENINGGYIFSVNSVVEIPKEPVKQSPIIKSGIGDGWCVSYVKYITGVTYAGDAWYWKNYINTTEPIIGDIVVLNESRLGHVAVIKGIYDDSILITEQNYNVRYIISERTISKSYPYIVGYIHVF